MLKMKPEDDPFVAINSDSELADFDNNFRVVAGPGAGKTYWLVKNIRHILRNSPRVSSTSHIACITYTNVASDEIKAGLEKGEDRVESSTIHSFLYKNIVKPYAFLLKEEDGTSLIDFARMDGHDEHRPIFFPTVSEWINSIDEMKMKKFKLLTDRKTQGNLLKCLESLNWHIESGRCILRFGKTYGVPKVLIPRVEEYKKRFWSKGQIHHEDVLYFAYRILTENPSLCDFISSKFAYILIDEFQDTHPVQTAIVKLLVTSGSIVGVIGDGAQSIYQFQGAQRKDFLEFAVGSQVDFKIEGNRRSTQMIIDLLNHVRSGDPVKQKQQGIAREGHNIHVLIGDDPAKILSTYEALAGGVGYADRTYVLAIKNETVSRLKGKKDSNEGSWERLRAMDPAKTRFLERIIASEEYAHERRFETALKEVLRIFKDDTDGNLRKPFKSGALRADIEKRGVAVSMLEFIISNRESLIGGNALNFYERLNDFLFECWQIRLQEFSKGKKKEGYEAVQVVDLLNSLRLGEESKSRVRTIHKSKGAQFKSVLVYLDSPADIAHILTPDINADDDTCRLIYVGLSRAEDFLCVSVPKTNADDERKLKVLNINVIRP